MRPSGSWRTVSSSGKQNHQSSPGMAERITGCPAALKWARACRLGLESQQPTWPQAMHWRRLTQVAPSGAQSSQTSPGRGGSCSPMTCWHGCVAWVMLASRWRDGSIIPQDRGSTACVPPRSGGTRVGPRRLQLLDPRMSPPWPSATSSRVSPTRTVAGPSKEQRWRSRPEDNN
jgi:hypothetical protein